MATPHEIDERARRIRLPRKVIALSTGLSENTIGRLLSGDGGRVSSLERVRRAVEAEERELLDHLTTLHGDGRAV